MELTDRVVPTSATRNWYSPGGNTVFPRRASTGRVSLPWKVSWPHASGTVPASDASPSKATIPSERCEPNLVSSVFISFLLFEFFDGHTGSAERASRFICFFEQHREVLGQDALPGGTTGRAGTTRFSSHVATGRTCWVHIQIASCSGSSPTQRIYGVHRSVESAVACASYQSSRQARTS